jgi:UDP-N-acetylglucosamine transferase subunit ALG13
MRIKIRATQPIMTACAKICLAASGGGHVRQLLDLQPAWENTAHFFVTEDTALGRSVSQKHPTEFVPHVALGQAKLGKPIAMIKGAIKSFFTSAAMMRRQRPSLFVTTGAGSMFFPMIWARLFGAKVILIDSFARFEAPSAFARIGGPFAHVKISQARLSGEKWRADFVFEPFRILGTQRPEKEPLLFATVGATLPFDRLVRQVDEARRAGLIPERIVVQTGEDGFRPDGCTVHETLNFDQMKELLAKADIVVCHGGTGSLITALQAGCKIVAVPRLYDRSEHYDDHQLEIVAAFAARGLIAVSRSEADFAEALQMARALNPVCATTDPAELISFLKQEISRIS